MGGRKGEKKQRKNEERGDLGWEGRGEGARGVRRRLD